MNKQKIYDKLNNQKIAYQNQIKDIEEKMSLLQDCSFARYAGVGFISSLISFGLLSVTYSLSSQLLMFPITNIINVVYFGASIGVSALITKLRLRKAKKKVKNTFGNLNLFERNEKYINLAMAKEKLINRCRVIDLSLSDLSYINLENRLKKDINEENNKRVSLELEDNLKKLDEISKAKTYINRFPILRQKEFNQVLKMAVPLFISYLSSMYYNYPFIANNLPLEMENFVIPFLIGGIASLQATAIKSIKDEQLLNKTYKKLDNSLVSEYSAGKSEEVKLNQNLRDAISSSSRLLLKKEINYLREINDISEHKGENKSNHYQNCIILNDENVNENKGPVKKLK